MRQCFRNWFSAWPAGPVRFFVHVLLGLTLFVPLVARSESELPIWIVNTKLSGDFRYRHEGIDRELTDALYRNRVRYRIGIQTQVNEHVLVGMRLATGRMDPRSTNQDLEDGLTPKFIYLDRAYGELTDGGHWWTTMGRFANPMTATDLQWDADVAFEGGVVRYSRGEAIKTTVTAGGIWLEPYRNQHGAGIWVGQATLAGQAGDAKWTASAGVYSYVLGAMVDPVANGNTLLNNRYLRDYEVFDVVFSATLPGMMKSKWTVTLNPLLNTATSEKNTGWLASVNWKGKVLERSASWSYDYRTLEADAVIGSFVDSDVAGGRTDQRSHRLSAEMGVIEGFSLGGAAIFSTLSSQGDSDWYQRWMLDGQIKF